MKLIMIFNKLGMGHPLMVEDEQVEGIVGALKVATIRRTGMCFLPPTPPYTFGMLEDEITSFYVSPFITGIQQENTPVTPPRPSFN